MAHHEEQPTAKRLRLRTRVGELALRVPQVRPLPGSEPLGFYPKSLERGLRSERALKLAGAEMLVLDARYEKVRHGGAVIDCAVLVAMGVREEDGKRTLLGVSVSLSEAEVHWRNAHWMARWPSPG